VPGVPEANRHEPLLPWGRYHQGRVVLGSRVEASCATPADLHHAATLYKQEKFVLCYRADKKKVGDGVGLHGYDKHTYGLRLCCTCSCHTVYSTE